MRRRKADNLISFDDLLMRYVHHAIINLSDVVGSSTEEIMNKTIKKVHKYRIQKPKEGAKDKRWFTYIPDRSKARGTKRIAANSEAELEAILFQVYADIIEESKNSEITIGELYQMWTNYKEQFCKTQNKKKSRSLSTINRYRRDYKKYVRGTPLDNMIITDITSIILEEELKSIIVKNHLKEDFSNNLIGYFRMMFRFAYRSRLVKTNEFDFVDTDIILAFAENNRVKAEEEHVLTVDELGRLVTATRQHEIKHPFYMPDYAIELASLTGMRAGELSALHWTDIDVKHGYINIDYSEHRIDYEDHSELVIDEPKCLKHRKFPIGDAISELLERIRSLEIDSEYVFGKPGGGRYTGHDISCACGRRAKEAGVGRTSIYRIRKTVVSEMRKHYPVKLVSNLVGHLEETDECYYNFDNSEAYEKLEAVNSYASIIIPFNREKQRKIRSYM